MARRSARLLGLAAGGVLIAVLALAPPRACAQAAPVPAEQGASSGLPVPRFVSLKSDRVNLRSGPGTEYPTSWVFRRAGMPVEVLKEFEGWRQVRDAEGVTGWVLHSLLSGRRTALVLPWELKRDPVPRVTLRTSAEASASAVAVIEAGVIANISDCDGRWCRVVIGNFRGYIEQSKLWGVYPGEIIR